MSRDAARSTSCPICWTTFTPHGRQVYCTDRCRKTAYERRRRDTAAPQAIAASAPMPVAERDCPHCGHPIAIVALLTTPQLARPQTPSAASEDAVILLRPRPGRDL